MLRDKTGTHQRLIPCICQKFLEYGYEKASLKNIARNAGITAAGMYRHFPSKEAMFTAMVKPVTIEFLHSCDDSMKETYAKLAEKDFLENFNDFREQKNKAIICYMYDHYDAFRRCSFVQKVHNMSTLKIRSLSLRRKVYWTYLMSWTTAVSHTIR